MDRATRGDYDLALLGWQADTTDPNDFLSALLASEAIGTTNRSRYRSPAMDAILQARHAWAPTWASASRSTAKRRTSSRREMPWVPLYHASVFTAYRRGVRGLLTGPTGVTRFDKAWKLE